MSSYRDRLLGFLRARAPGSAGELFAREPSAVPSCRPTEPDLAARFRREVEAVGGEVAEVGAATAAADLGGLLGSGASGRAAIDRDPGWAHLGFSVPEALGALGLEVTEVEAGASGKALAGFRLGVSMADLAIAETGTIVQCAQPFRPRSVSLVPEWHLVVLPRSRLVAGFEDFFECLASGGGIGRFDHYFTWITGPSRTADIEKVLTVGVHGPGRLLVALADAEGEA